MCSSDLATRPDFRVFTGNDLAIDMVMYGSDYLLGLSTFAPDVFAKRDAAWAAGDPAFYELNDLLQYLGFLAFRGEGVALFRDTVEAFIGRGGNVAFLSGNTAFWQVRLEDRTAQGPATTMVGYKGMFKNDPVYGTERQGELTTIWSDVLVERPENLMTGVSFARGGYHRIGKRATNGAGGYTVHRADHWLFDGTGLGYGDVLGAASTIVGYECDGCDFTYRDGLPYPTGADGTPSTFEILGTAPAAHFTRTTAARPPRPDEPSELEFKIGRAHV